MARFRIWGTPKSAAHRTLDATVNPRAPTSLRKVLNWQDLRSWGTFSITKIAAPVASSTRTYSRQSWFRGSFGSREPSWLNPWYGGAPTTT